MILNRSFHTPVLLPQVIKSLNVRKGRKYIDATLGGGGYAFEILKLGGIVLGIDQDQDAIDYVREKLKDGSCLPAGEAGKLEERKNLYLEHGNFRDLKKIAHSKGFGEVAGIIFDLGMSSYQIEGSGRGFSYRKNEPLDMRMDKKNKLKASDLINTYSKDELYEIFTKYSEEIHSRPIAEAIVRARSLEGKIDKTGQLTKIIEGVLERIDPAGKLNKTKAYQGTKARIFQALRIAVNNELENLKSGLEQAFELLDLDGRLSVLTYHSLEDRIVKLTFKDKKYKSKLKDLKIGYLEPDWQEIKSNPKARSAKLRSVERIN